MLTDNQYFFGGLVRSKQKLINQFIIAVNVQRIVGDHGLKTAGEKNILTSHFRAENIQQDDKPSASSRTSANSNEMGGKGKNKERVKTLSNSTVTLKPRLLSFLDSATSNRSPGWRLLTPGALPLKLSMMISCKQKTGH